MNINLKFSSTSKSGQMTFVLLFYLLFGLTAFAQTDQSKLIETDKVQRQDTESNHVDEHLIKNIFSGSVQLPKEEKTGVPLNQKSMLCPTQQTDSNIDGTCHNINLNSTASWGAANIQLRRAIPDVYNNNNDLVGQSRKNPREISNLIFEGDGCKPSSQRLSSFVFTWGQFLDHDITLTPENDSLSVPIPPVFGDFITAPIGFHRSEAFPGTGTGTGIPRQQRNNITSWIDGSNVYGSDATRANYLRTFVDGKLKIANSPNGDLLPLNTVNNQPFLSPIDSNAPFMAGNVNPSSGMPVRVFVAGDVRANEQPGLTALHTLFLREHNRICDQLVLNGMTNDEAIYQRARKEVGAIIQSITYNEFLPSLGIQLPTYNGYDNTVQPDISNVFAMAAFRLGHTMVTDNIVLYDDNGNYTGNRSLFSVFFMPAFITMNGIEEILNGLAQQFQEEIDAQIVENLRSFLFTPMPIGPGLDLAALNIQRGRDHGLDDYNAFRQFFTGTTANSFADITSDVEVQNQLALAYNNDVNDIDVWVGLLAEDHLPNAAIGNTLHAILTDQFTRLRDGDFYFFENDPAFTTAEKNTINNTSLSDIIKRNTNIVNIKNQVFYAPCPNFRFLGLFNNNITNNATQTFKVSNAITARNTVDNTSDATYDAGFQVTLRPGFDAEMGCDFHALINGCNSGAFNKKAVDEEYSINSMVPKTKLRNAPNPFYDFTKIEYELLSASVVNMWITDVKGKTVAQVISNQMTETGTHQIDFDGSNLPNGIYVLTIQTDTEVVSQKMILSR